ncbi:MAG: FHA domain-containing protein [Acidobacteria bacterium]|nr:FHA domain-containing protein [Acidobacteriota bacterium]
MNTTSRRGELHLRNDEQVKVFALEAARFTIGRGPENSLCLPHGVVSRLHAEIVRLGDDYMLRDLGSTNGSFVNSGRVSEQMLNDGDLLRFGHGGPELDFVLVVTSGMLYAEPATERHPKSTTTNLIESLSGRVMPTDPSDEANTRRVLAEAHLNQGQPARALEMLDKYAQPSALDKLSTPYRASVLLWLGRSYIEAKQYDLALETLMQSLGNYAEVNDEAGGAEVHASLGRALIGNGELLAGRDHLQRATLAARRAGNARLLADAHYLLGKVEWKEGDFEGARYHWLRAARLAETTTDAVLRARVKMQEAFVLYAEARLKEAVPLYQEVIEQFKELKHVRLLVKAYSGLSRVHARLGSWGAAARLVDERLQLAEAEKLAKAEALAYTDLAELKLYQGDLGEARKAIQNAIAKHGDSIYARTQRVLGRIHLASGERTQAIEEIEKGLATAREKGALEEQVLCELKLANIYLDQKEFDKAVTYITSAEMSTSLDPSLGLAGRVIFTRANLYAAQKHNAEANRGYAQSLSIFQSIGDVYRTGQCEAAIGELRLQTGRLESARAHFERAQAIFAKLGATGELHRIEARLTAGLLVSVQGALTQTMPNASKTAFLSLARPAAEKGATAMLTTPQTILLAIGQGELADLMGRGLEAENYVVERVQDGKTGLAMVIGKERNFSLLILDALLEFKSGFDVCRELRKAKLETPVILLGSRHGIEDKIEALQAGADDFLSKRNLVFEELLAKMEALLR